MLRCGDGIGAFDHGWATIPRRGVVLYNSCHPRLTGGLCRVLPRGSFCGLALPQIWRSLGKPEGAMSVHALSPQLSLL